MERGNIGGPFCALVGAEPNSSQQKTLYIGPATLVDGLNQNLL
jgi:hypothetical protein